MVKKVLKNVTIESKKKCFFFIKRKVLIKN